MTARLVIVVTCLLAGGCAGMENKYSAELAGKFDASRGASLIVLSAGAADRCIPTPTFLKLLPADKPYGSTAIALPSVDAYSIKSDFPSHQGYLHVISVPAGEYYFAQWTANSYVDPKKVPKASFSVSAGEIVYLGEYFIPIACSPTTQARINDRMERDLALVKQKNPSIDTSRAVKRLLSFSGYAVDRGNGSLPTLALEQSFLPRAGPEPR